MPPDSASDSGNASSDPCVPGSIITPTRRTESRKIASTGGRIVSFPPTSPCAHPESAYKVHYRVGKEHGKLVVLCSAVETPQRPVLISVTNPGTESEENSLKEIVALREAMAVHIGAGNPLTFTGRNRDERSLKEQRIFHGIVPLLTYFYAEFGGEQRLCLVTPLHGPSLRTVIRTLNSTGRHLPLSVFRHISFLLFIIVAELHYIGICHCGINPETIRLTIPAIPQGTQLEDITPAEIAQYNAESVESLLSANSQPGIVITGLESACFMPGPQLLPAQKGEPHSCSAPETLLSMNYGFSVDVWSAGCVILELLTGNAPFTGTSHWEQLTNIWKLRPQTATDSIGMMGAAFLIRSTFSPRVFTGIGRLHAIYKTIRSSEYYSHYSDAAISLAIMRWATCDSYYPQVRPRSFMSYFFRDGCKAPEPSAERGGKCTLTGLVLNSLCPELDQNSSFSASAIAAITSAGYTAAELRMLTHLMGVTLIPDPEFRPCALQIAAHPFFTLPITRDPPSIAARNLPRLLALAPSMFPDAVKEMIRIGAKEIPCPECAALSRQSLIPALCVGESDADCVVETAIDYWCNDVFGLISRAVAGTTQKAVVHLVCPLRVVRDSFLVAGSARSPPIADEEPIISP